MPCWPPKVLGTSQQGPLPYVPLFPLAWRHAVGPCGDTGPPGEIAPALWSGTEVWPVAGPLSWWALRASRPHSTPSAPSAEHSLV